MNFNIYKIPQQSDIFRFRNVFAQFEIKYSTKNQTYSNIVALDSLDEEKLLDILESNKYKYEVISSENSTINPLEANYKLFLLDAKNIFVIQRSSNKKEFYINKENSTISILDIENTSYSNHNSTSSEDDLVLDLLFEFNNNNAFKEKNYKLFSILLALSKSHTKEMNLNDKLKTFKYAVIDRITKTNKNGFLCNCIDGFFPETSFFIKGNKIYSDFTDNFIEKNQEQRIWKFLFENQSRIGAFKQPTIKDLFIGRKINVIDQFGNETKCIINRVTKDNISNLLEVSVYTGLNSFKLKNRYSEKELDLLVKASRWNYYQIQRGYS